MFLHCDESVSAPQVTTEGDSRVIFNYVIRLCFKLSNFMHNNVGSCIELQIFDITAKEVCPGGGAAGGVAPGELGIVLILVWVGTNRISVNCGMIPFLITIEVHIIQEIELYIFYFSILPLGFISYFVIGALIMKYRYNASGTDIIPNKKFWMSLPFLIKVWLAVTQFLLVKLCH